jgi:hypothetical protein
MSRFHRLVASNWPNEDDVYGMGIFKFGIGVEELQHPLVPARVFHGWLEDWETGLLKNDDKCAEAKLLRKYKGWFTWRIALMELWKLLMAQQCSARANALSPSIQLMMMMIPSP